MALLISLLISAIIAVCRSQLPVCQCSTYDNCKNNLSQQRLTAQLNCINTTQATAAVSAAVSQCYQLQAQQEVTYKTNVHLCLDRINGAPCVGNRGILSNSVPPVPTINIATGNNGRRRKRHLGGRGGISGILTSLGVSVNSQITAFETTLSSCKRNSGQRSGRSRNQCAVGCTLQSAVTNEQNAHQICQNEAGINPTVSLCNCLATANVGITSTDCQNLSTSVAGRMFGRGDGNRRGNGGRRG